MIGKHALLGLLVASLLACQTPSITPETSPSDKLNAFFERAFNEELELSPQHMSYLSIKQKYDQLDDLSEQQAVKRRDLAQQHLAELKSFPFEALDTQAQLSYRLFEKRAEDKMRAFDRRYYNYPVNQMFGVQADLPAFLINIHRVDNEQDALAYIARLRAVSRQFTQLREGLAKRASLGIIAPRLVYPKVLDDCRNVLVGFPFEDKAKDSVLLADFQSKIKALKLSPEREAKLRKDAIAALQESVAPAYRDLIVYVKELEKKAPSEVGMWTLPNGLDIYAEQLKDTTTTSLSADEIHQIGLREVARIRKEMSVLQKQLGYKGSLREFFDAVRKDPRFYYPQTDEGKAAYLQDNQKLLDRIEQRLPEFFVTLPQDKLNVKPVEAYREKSAEVAFYTSPAPDGSRPGVYYVNLYDLRQVPKYKMEALAYHEGLPGHHLQLSISQKLQGIPKFRRFGGYTAYVEGWGLYSERFPKELGFYQDPYSDLGRLSMEMWRAARLVIDTGIHAKRWTREKSIAYLEDNTPADRGEIVKAVERYIVMPSQATAYMMGMLKILEIRKGAQDALGAKFQMREFHEQILKDGPLPLDLLEKKLAQWVQQQKG